MESDNENGPVELEPTLSKENSVVVQIDTNQKKNVDEDAVDDDSKYANVDWDFVIMFGNLDPPTDKNGNRFPEEHKKMKSFYEHQTKRKQLVKRLKNADVGLYVTRKRSVDGKSVYLLISAPQDRLEKEAERVGLSMLLKSNYGGGYAPYEIEDKEMFEGSDNEFNFFRKNQKHYLLTSIIQGDSAYGGAEINLSRLLKAGVITKLFPLHDEKKQDLVDNWAHWRNIFKYQPLEDIRNYYGEEVGFYFAWLGFYTTWLWAASLLGLVAFIMYMIDKNNGGGEKFGVWVITAYSIFLAFWATLFLEYWKRYSSSLSYKWGMLDYEDVEITRPDYQGQDAYGVYHKGHWVPLDPAKEKEYGFVVPKSKYYPNKIRHGKIIGALPILAVMVVAVVICTLAVLSFRLFVQNYNSFGGSLAGGVANAITIMFLNVFWKKVAVRLTEWENHRTQTDFDNALIFKIFIFYFVNSYTSLYYIAFFKNGNKFWNISDLEDKCSDSDIPGPELLFKGCVDELTFQLAVLLGTNMIFGQAREVAIPWVLSKLNLKMFQKGLDQDQLIDLPRWEKESKKHGYQGTFDEYSEMVIQYGFLTLFAAAFPLAPLMAVANNMIEIRTDAFKLLTATQRPNYQGANGIGSWHAVLEVLGVIAVITNCLLIGFSFSALPNLLDSDRFYVLGVVIIMEHGILFIKYMIALLVPDTPGWVVKQISFQNYIKEQTFKKVTGVSKNKSFEDDLNDVDRLINDQRDDLFSLKKD